MRATWHHRPTEVAVPRPLWLPPGPAGDLLGSFIFSAISGASDADFWVSPSCILTTPWFPWLQAPDFSQFPSMAPPSLGTLSVLALSWTSPCPAGWGLSEHFLQFPKPQLPHAATSHTLDVYF